MKTLLSFLIILIVGAGIIIIIYEVKTMAGWHQTEISAGVTTKAVSAHQNNCAHCHGKWTGV